MPQMIVADQVLTDQTLLDFGISDLVVHKTADGTYLYSTSGPGGGVAAFEIDPGGGLRMIDFVHFTPAMSGAAMECLTLLDTAHGTQLVVAGATDGALMAFGLGPDGRLGTSTRIDGLVDGSALVSDIDQLAGQTLFVANPGSGSIDVYAMTDAGSVARQFSMIDTPAIYADSVFALETASVAGNSYLLGASLTEQGVTAYRVTPDGLLPTGRLGSADGIGIMTPNALASTLLDGRYFVLIGSAPDDGAGQSGAITVMELTADGRLVATDHVIDTGTTHFGMLQSLHLIEAQGFTYVLAGGGDDGVTLFVLLPNGRLQLVDTLADGSTAGLENVSAIAAAPSDTRLDIFVASEISGGITRLGFDISAHGSVLSAAAAGGVLSGTALNDSLIGGAGDDHLIGGAGDDILEDGAGADQLTGGAGRDVFVLRADASRDHITDFDPLRDRLDLSDWPFLYDADALDIRPTATGAIVSWRHETLVIDTLLGDPLSAAELRAALLPGPERSPVPFADPMNPNLVLSGTWADDSLLGGAGHDSIFGDRGYDLLQGEGGDDHLSGGPQADNLYGGAGHDVLDGGDGFDRLFGGMDNDLLIGGAGPDALFGELGHDTLDGGDGDDRLYGGGGFDLMRGGRGDDTLWGGTRADNLLGDAGDDRLFGGDGFDRLFGGTGDDLLFGENGPDALFGELGNDTLDGGEGDDRLHGGAGHDRLIGGLGDDDIWGNFNWDIFVFADGHGRDTIHDFAATNPYEKIDLSGITGFAGITDYDGLRDSGAVSAVAGGVQIDTGHGNSIFLAGVAFGDLDSSDFLF